MFKDEFRMFQIMQSDQDLKMIKDTIRNLLENEYLSPDELIDIIDINFGEVELVDPDKNELSRFLGDEYARLYGQKFVFSIK